MEFLGLRYAMPISIESVSTESVHEAINGQKFIVRKPYQYWRFRIRLEPKAQQFDESAWGQLIAHRAQHQQGGTFPMIAPQPYLCDIERPGAEGAHASRISGSNNVFTVTDTIAIFLNCIVPGRMVQLMETAANGGTPEGPGKLYMITSVGNRRTVNGQFVVDDVSFFPALNITAGDSPARHLRTWDPVGRFRYAETGDDAITLNSSGIIDTSITVEEAL